MFVGSNGANISFPQSLGIPDSGPFCDIAANESICNKNSWIIGFIIFIPFVVIDLVVSSSLMSLGMMMLPPVSVSLPFKLLLFVLVDGWGLVVTSLVQSYHTG